MGLQQNLQDIQTNLLSAKTAIAQSISSKGVECSADDKLSIFAEKIDSISGGSTGGTGEKFVVPNGMKFGYSSEFDPTMFDVSQVTDMSYMFGGCSGLTGELDLSDWNTSNVTTMKYMFTNSSKLENINLSSLNISRVTNMGYMFNNCSKLASIDVSGWNTSNVTTMENMFYYCSGLTSLNLSDLNVENVSTFEYMFSGCKALESLNLSNINKSKIRYLANIFYSCTSLVNLQFSDLGHNQYCTSIDLSPCSALTKDSVLYLFNNAFDRTAAGYSATFTIKLHSNTKALLTEEEIAIATNKGFTVV